MWIAPAEMDEYAPGVDDPVLSMRVLITQIGFVRIAVKTPVDGEG